MKITYLLTALLIASVCANVFFLASSVPLATPGASAFPASANENALLPQETNHPAEARLAREENAGFAFLQAPSVSQLVTGNSRGRYTGTVVQKGQLMNISVEVRPGEGRVLVQTKPLMGITFQDAANTAVAVAGNRTGTDLSQSDVIFSIESGSQIAAVDGPSAGALMTLLSIAAIEKRPVNQSLTLTGTINSDGRIGAIGGVVPKAAAAKESGKTLFLIPAANQLITPPVPGTQAGTYVDSPQSRQQVPAKDYIEKNVGIPVAYVKTIDDVVAAAMGPLQAAG